MPKLLSYPKSVIRNQLQKSKKMATFMIMVFFEKSSNMPKLKKTPNQIVLIYVIPVVLPVLSTI